MSSIPRTSGIYKIVCSATRKVYVGSSANLHRRQIVHWCHMRKGKHGNRHLQGAWNKYGESTFSFVVIELVLSSFLLEREQYWIDKLGVADDRKGFNLTPTAGSLLGMKRPGDVCRKISIGRRGKGLYTEEMRHARSEDQKRLWRIPEYRARGSAVMSKKWIVTDPDGNEFSIINLNCFCTDHGLDVGHMWAIAKGNRKRHKGWQCRRIDNGE